MKNRIVSLFLAATMVLGLCPVSIRAEAASADTVQVQEISAAESKQSSPVDEEPVITGTGSEGELPPEEPVIIGTGKEQGAASEDVKQEETKQEETKQEKSQESEDFWNEDEELMLYGLSDLDTEEDGKLRSAGTYDLDTVLSQTVGWKKGSNDSILNNEDFLKIVSSTSADWTVVWLGRLGVKEEDYTAFLNRANTYVKDMYDQNPSTGLSTNTPTEWHRLTLAVLAAGGDPTNVGGHNLIADGTYNCLAGAPWDQGMNGAAWALLALDSRGYDVPENATYTREDLIQYILDKELSGGGWSLDNKNPSLDLDITSMVIYALAPHCAENAKVREAANRGLDVLRNKISEDGDYSYGGIYNCESVAQAIVAFTAMGIDPTTVTNAASGKSLMDGLMKYYSTGTGGFLHAYYDNEKQNRPNGMATDQAMYSIAAYLYYKEGVALFDFRAKANTTQYVAQADNSSVFTAEAGATTDLYVGPEVKELTFTNLPVGNYDAAEVTVDGAEGESWKTGIRGADGYTPVKGAIPVADGTVLNIAVTKQDGSTENWKLTVHTSADAETKSVIDRIDALPDVGVLTLDDKATVLSVREAYDKLTDAEKTQVTNADKLKELEAQLTKLEAAAEKELAAKRAALEKNVDAIATPVKIGDKSLVNQYLLELDTLGDWDDKEAIAKKLNGYLTDIAARQKLVDDLDKDIWNQVDPLRVNQSKANTVKKLMSRYAALRLDEQKLLANGQSLQDAGSYH